MVRGCDDKHSNSSKYLYFQNTFQREENVFGVLLAQVQQTKRDTETQKEQQQQHAECGYERGMKVMLREISPCCLSLCLRCVIGYQHSIVLSAFSLRNKRSTSALPM